jgi:enamine deaminase RidA (YjgF/YER057c/UK114 family)
VVRERQRVPTTAPWAEKVGYSRAVRVGGVIAVSGTAAVGPDGRIVHPGDAYAQARRCCEIIVAALRELGADASDVIRTRMYIREGVNWSDVGRAHGEYFRTALPATTMIVTGFIDPAMLVEIEADAVVAE